MGRQRGWKTGVTSLDDAGFSDPILWKTSLLWFLGLLKSLIHFGGGGNGSLGSLETVRPKTLWFCYIPCILALHLNWDYKRKMIVVLLSSPFVFFQLFAHMCYFKCGCS